MSFETPIGPQHIKNGVVFNSPRTPRDNKIPKSLPISQTVLKLTLRNFKDFD